MLPSRRSEALRRPGRRRSALRFCHRPAEVHRLSRVHGGVQGGERRAGGGLPDLGEVRREGDLAGHAPLLHRAPLQPLRSGALRHDLPGLGAREAPRTGSSISTATAASAAAPACRPAPTTPSTSTRTTTPPPSATTASIASSRISCLPASSSVLKKRSSPEIWTMPQATSPV